MTTTFPGPDAPPLVRTPDSWRRVVFVADLHLGAQSARTADAFCRWVGAQAADADALFILGDLFEAWIGDDMLRPEARVHIGDEAAVAQQVCAALQGWTARGHTLFVQHGNRDFLLGPDFAQTTGAQLLSDPVVLEFAGQRLLLTHGDQLCIADSVYLRFRAQVRNPDWQRMTLSQPLAARAEQARALRTASRTAQSRAELWADAEPQEAARWLARAGCCWMIHGHTHRPRDHWHDGSLRQVLSDWDLDGAHDGGRPRAQAIWLEREDAALAVRRASISG